MKNRKKKVYSNYIGEFLLVRPCVTSDRKTSGLKWTPLAQHASTNPCAPPFVKNGYRWLFLAAKCH